MELGGGRGQSRKIVFCRWRRQVREVLNIPGCHFLPLKNYLISIISILFLPILIVVVLTGSRSGRLSSSPATRRHHKIYRNGHFLLFVSFISILFFSMDFTPISIVQQKFSCGPPSGLTTCRETYKIWRDESCFMASEHISFGNRVVLLLFFFLPHGFLWILRIELWGSSWRLNLFYIHSKAAPWHSIFPQCFHVCHVFCSTSAIIFDLHTQ